MAHDTSDRSKLPASPIPSRSSDPDAMQRSWLLLDGAAAETAPSPTSSTKKLLSPTGESFAPPTPPQQEASRTKKLEDEQRKSTEAAKSGVKKALEVEDAKKEAASEEVQHVWHKIMVADAFGLGMPTIIQDIVDALTISTAGGSGSQPDANQATAEADGSFTFSTLSRNGKTRIHYKVVDMPGAGDDFDVQKRIKAATDYIAEQNRIFYMKWTTYMRESPEDERVSCVLYFVNPHAIKPVDLEIMAAIGKAAPLVPVIAKGDSMSEAEEQEFRQHVTLDLEDKGITTFSFPALTKELEKAFSVVSSDDDGASNAKRQVKVKRQAPAHSERIAFHRHPKGDRSLLRSMVLEENVTRLRKFKSQYFTDFVRSLEHSPDAPITERLSAAGTTLVANSRAVSSLVNAAGVSGAAPTAEDDVAGADAAGGEKRSPRGRKDDHTKLALGTALLLLLALNFLSIISPVRVGSCCKDLTFSEATAVSLRQALNEQMLQNGKLSQMLADTTLEHKQLRQAMEQKVNEVEEMSTRLAAYVKDNSRLAEDNSRLFQNVTSLQDKLRGRDGLHVFEFLAMKDWVHNVKGLLGRNFTIPSY